MKGATQGSQMFKETIYLNLKGFHTGGVLEQFSNRYKHMHAVFFYITSILDLAFVNRKYVFDN